MLLKENMPRLVLSGVILLALSGLLVLAVVWRDDSPHPDVALEKVTFSRDAAGKPVLAVQGEGLHGSLRAMLIPDRQLDDISSANPDVSAVFYQCATDGRLAVATANDQRVLTLDVTAGQPVRVLGSLQLSQEKLGSGAYATAVVALVGSRAVIARNSVGLLLLDVSDPRAPSEVSRVELPINLTDLAVGHDGLYAVGRGAGLLKVTYAGDRLHVRSLPGNQGAWRLAVDGRRLVTTGHNGELALYEADARDRMAPVGSLALRQEVRDLVLTRDALYLVTADSRLLIYSTATWPRLVPAGDLELKGQPLRLEAARELPLLFCTLVGKGVAAIDVGSALKPHVAGVFNMSRPASSVQFKGGRLFLAGIAGLHVLPTERLRQLLSVAAPESVSPLAPGSGKVRLLVRGGKLFAYNSRSLVYVDGGSAGGAAGEPLETFLALPENDGVRLHALRGGVPDLDPSARVPISDPNQLSNDIDYSISVHDAAWRDGMLFVLSRSQLQIFPCDASGTGPQLAAHQLPGETLHMAWVTPKLLAVAYRSSERNGVELVDVSVPGAPRVAGAVLFPRHQRTVGDIRALLADDSRLYVSRSRLGVEIYDLAQPAQPKLVQRIDTPGSAGRLSLQNGLLAVSDLEAGVFFIDVNGEYVVPAGTYRLPVVAHDVLMHGGQLLVTNATGDIFRFALPQRLNLPVGESGRNLELPVPQGLPPGAYTLSLYDGENSVEWPVTVPAAPPAQNL